MEINFRVHVGDITKEVSHEKIIEYAKFCGLERIAKGRYSSLLVINLMSLENLQGIDPAHVVEEIKYLEGLTDFTMTKPATQFKGEILRGLWHKHFFPPLPSSHANNIMNYFGKNGLRSLIEEIFDPSKSPTVTEEMIQELSNRVSTESLEQRHSQNKITGEWIVFAKHQNKNYYLSVSPHTAGDKQIASNIKVACVPEFEFLSKYLS